MKLVHLVGFIIKKFVIMHGHMNVKKYYILSHLFLGRTVRRLDQLLALLFMLYHWLSQHAVQRLPHGPILSRSYPWEHPVFTHVDVERVHVLRFQRPIGSRRVTGPGHYCVWLCTFLLLRDARLEWHWDLCVLWTV